MLSAAYDRFEIAYDSSDSERADDTPPIEQDELASTEAAGQRLTPSPIAVPSPPPRDSDSSDPDFVFTPGTSKKERSVTFEGLSGRPVVTPMSRYPNGERVKKNARFETPVGDLNSPIEKPTNLESSIEDPLVRQLDASRELLQRIDSALARPSIQPKHTEQKKSSVEGEEEEEDIVVESVDVVNEEEEIRLKVVVEHEEEEEDIEVESVDVVNEEEEIRLKVVVEREEEEDSNDVIENEDSARKSELLKRESDSRSTIIVNHQGNVIPQNRPVLVSFSDSEDDLNSKVGSSTRMENTSAVRILSNSEEEQSPQPRDRVIPNFSGSFGNEEDVEDVDTEYDNFMQLNISGESSHSDSGETDLADLSHKYGKA
jgi:hypothetical protein